MTYPPPSSGPVPPVDRTRPAELAGQRAAGDPPGDDTAPIPGAAYPMPPTRHFPGVPDAAPVSVDPFASPASGPPYPPPPGPYPPPPGPYPPAGGYPVSGAYPPPPGAPPGGGYPSAAPPMPGQAPTTAPARRRNGPLIAVVVVIALMLCGGTAIAAVLAVRAAVLRAEEAVAPLTDPANRPDLPALPTDLPGTGDGTPVTVVYEVTGDGPVDLTYVEQNGGSPRQVNASTLPWRVEVSLTPPTLLSVTAFRAGTTTGTLACRVTVNGEEVARKETQGSISVVSCTKFHLG